MIAASGSSLLPDLGASLKYAICTVYRNPQMTATNTNEVQRISEEGEIVIATHREVTETETRAVLEISSKKSDGVEIIKSTPTVVESSKCGSKTAVSYIGAPRYRIVMSAENVRIGEKSVSNAVEKIRIAIEKHMGAFSFKSEQAKMVFQSGQAR